MTLTFCRVLSCSALICSSTALRRLFSVIAACVIWRSGGIIVWGRTPPLAHNTDSSAPATTSGIAAAHRSSDGSVQCTSACDPCVGVPGAFQKIALDHPLTNLPLSVIASNHLPVDRVKLVHRHIISLCKMTVSPGKPRSHILNRGTLPSSNLCGLSVFVNKHPSVIDANYTSSITPQLSFPRGSLQAQPWP